LAWLVGYPVDRIDALLYSGRIGANSFLNRPAEYDDAYPLC
jgi:hypothetical protein